MDSRKSGSSLGIAFGILAILLAAGGGYWFYGRAPKLTPEQLEAQRMARLRESDRRILKGEEKSNEYEIYGAFVRLGAISDPAALTAGLAKAADPVATIRQGAAEALGYFESPEALETLEKLLSDSDGSVRLHAIQGLGHRRSPEREKEIRSLLAKPGSKVGEAERVALYSSLIQTSQAAAVKKDAVAALVKIALKGDDAPSADAALRAVTLAPRETNVQAMAKQKLVSSKNDQVRSVVIRYLAALNDPELKNRISALLEDAGPQVRLAVVQSIHVVCPAGRADMIKREIASEKDKMVLEMSIREPLYLGPVEGKPILEETLRSNHLSPDHQRLVKSTLESFPKKARDAHDPCVGRER